MARPSRRETWVLRVSRTKTLPPTTRLFLSIHLAARMDAKGYVEAPRNELADAAGITERRVAQHLQLAKERKWLDQYGKGHRGHIAAFNAVIPDARRVKEPFTQSAVPMGERNQHPMNGKVLSPFPSVDEMLDSRATRALTTATTVPNHRDSVPVRFGWDRFDRIYGEKSIADRSASDLELLVASVDASFIHRRARQLVSA